MNDLVDEYVPVGTTRNSNQAGLWSLVLLSADIPNITEHPFDHFVIMVRRSQIGRAELEIASFEEENLNWPPTKDLTLQKPEIDKRPPTVIMMGSLLVMYMVTGPFISGSEWFRQGAVNSRAILEGGEWWRLITALTLHSDPVHVLGNIFLGGVVIHFLCKMYGTGLGWFMVMLSGTVANYANVIARGPGHISVGFSTAVFAAVGLLCGGQIKLVNLRAILLPMGAGVALLGMLGSSGERTDLGAHLWGLVVGLLFGMAWRWLGNNLHFEARGMKQTYLLVVTILFVWFAWVKALSV